MGVETSQGERIGARHIVVAPGREGADWLKERAQELDPHTPEIAEAISELGGGG